MKPTELTDQIARQIAQRLTLRDPLCDSLELLTHFAAVRPEKDADVAAALLHVQAVLDRFHDASFPHVPEGKSFTAFERDFPNLCFSLATGVGKTRLMGAFIAWLYKKHGIRNFFVVAPNLTIYDKLRADFGDPSSSKYVFNGIDVFAVEKPVIVTGDDYETGRGVRDEYRIDPELPGVAGEGLVHINIFNISKLTKDTKATDSKPARIKRLHECIGTSYFAYLAALPDLVLIMDEAHNYRASAGSRALNELNPVLGIELTATPFRTNGNERKTRTHPRTKVETQVTVPKREWFTNVAYDFQLKDAMEMGYVKEPVVAYRKDTYTTDQADDTVELMKLNDAVFVHEEIKADLLAYHANAKAKLVKPFILVVAEDIAHAEKLKATIESPTFHAGHFAGKVIVVHSKQPSEGKKDNLARLLEIEHPDNQDEIVIHIASLEEGWDVSNLYTIVPMKRMGTPSLVLQSMGRGLRLPFGTRVTRKGIEISPVDRLTIISHDRFQDILDEAQQENSPLTGFLRGRVLGDTTTPKPTVVQSAATPWQRAATAAQAKTAARCVGSHIDDATREAASARTTRIVEIAQAAAEAIAGARRLTDLNTPEVITTLTKVVEAALQREEPTQFELSGVIMPPVRELVEAAIAAFVEKAIDIPKIVVIASADYRLTYTDFDVDTSSVHWQAPSGEMEGRQLRDQAQTYTYRRGVGAASEIRLEDYVIRQLIDRPDIVYEEHTELLQKLATQLVAHLRSYLGDDLIVRQVLEAHEKDAGDLVYRQLGLHRHETASNWLTTVYPSMEALQAQAYKNTSGEPPRSYKDTVPDLSRIRRYVFTGFKRSGGEFCKFDSDAERRLACVLESDATVQKWLKPAREVLQLRWRLAGVEKSYEPDFVVEIDNKKYLIEVKADGDVTLPDVLAKAEAGTQWCRTASEHADKFSGKPWKYLLLRDSRILEIGSTMAGLERVAERLQF